MKKVELLNLKGEKVKDINLNEEIFGITPNKAVLNDAVILTMASLRQGTHKTKNRSEVFGVDTFIFSTTINSLLRTFSDNADLIAICLSFLFCFLL